MGLTAFPHGVSSFGIPQIGAGAFPYTTTGKVLFVHSGTGSDSPGRGQTPDEPLASIDYAVGLCTANKGDVIYAMPGHTETVSAAGGLDLDVAGVSIIGLGSGSNRPTVNFTTAVGADMDVDAANIRIENFLFTGGIDALTGPIDINAADCKLINCEYRDVTGQATDVIVADANADRLLIDGYRHDGASAAGGASAIALTGMDDVTIRNSVIYGNFSVGAIDCRTTAVTRLKVHDCAIWTENAADIAIVDTITASTGVMGPNLFMVLQDDAANVTEAITGATFYVMDFGVHVVNAVNQKSLAINWTAVIDS